MKGNNIEILDIGTMKQNLEVMRPKLEAYIEGWNTKKSKAEEGKLDFIISEKRKDEIKKHVFFGGETVGEQYNTFLNMENINENCYLFETISGSMIPKAFSEKKYDYMNFFENILDILSRCIYKRLFDEKNLFLLYEKNDTLLIKNNRVYLAYTDFYKDKCDYIYKRINNEQDFYALIKNFQLDGIVVTDGPNYIVPIDFRDILLYDSM